MHNIYYLGLSGEHRCPLGYLFVITLKFKQSDIFIEKFVQKVQMEWQIVKTLIRGAVGSSSSIAFGSSRV